MERKFAGQVFDGIRQIENARMGMQAQAEANDSRRSQYVKDSEPNWLGLGLGALQSGIGGFMNAGGFNSGGSGGYGKYADGSNLGFDTSISMGGYKPSFDGFDLTNKQPYSW
ncbi:MAG TPA: hypothetical protein DCX77_07770 [Acidimicrobiaceae bacterium]|nr:hypothetical protein [Acidimicrobiaceae bacterium]|tara:strand:- start:1696 stop:2031 length:336 start_codon:yes stop_codon:yes gene_type:complete